MKLLTNIIFGIKKKKKKKKNVFSISDHFNLILGPTFTSSSRGFFATFCVHEGFPSRRSFVFAFAVVVSRDNSSRESRLHFTHSLECCDLLLKKFVGSHSIVAILFFFSFFFFPSSV
jgi:hypothetical protein